MEWATLARFAWQAMQPPDPKSVVVRAQRAWDAYQEIGAGAELLNEVYKLSEGEKETCSSH